MRELLRTNDIVYISFARAALRSAGIDCAVLDEMQSVMDGSIGAIPRRVLVMDDDLATAQDVLRALTQDIEQEHD